MRGVLVQGGGGLGGLEQVGGSEWGQVGARGAVQEE